LRSRFLTRSPPLADEVGDGAGEGDAAAVASRAMD
jgi:hypothetical protein